jgi:hypothetical protein
MQTEQQTDDAIKAAKAAANIDYQVLVFEAPEKTPDANDGETFAFRRPNSGEWLRYRSERSSDQVLVQASAMKTLCLACRIYPDAAAFSKAIDDRPGLVEAISNELLPYAGAAQAKKVRRI